MFYVLMFYALGQILLLTKDLILYIFEIILTQIPALINIVVTISFFKLQRLNALYSTMKWLLLLGLTKPLNPDRSLNIYNRRQCNFNGSGGGAPLNCYPGKYNYQRRRP